jgi:hypothetical protein
VVDQSQPGVVDPRVVKAKVAREFDSWERNSDAYRRRGWFMLSRDDVVVDVGFMGAVPLGNTALDLLAAVVRFDYSDFDVRPPSVRFIDPRTGDDRIPVVRALTPTPDGPRDLLLNEHPERHRPFLCVPGVREYHEHPQHSGDLWELHRGGGEGSLAALCDLIWRTMAQNVIGFNVGVQVLPPPVNLQVQLHPLQGDVSQLPQNGV